MDTIKVSGMSCQHCVGAVTKALEGIEGLRWLRHWPSEKHLLSLLEDPELLVRREATQALTHLGTSQSIAPLTQRLLDPSDHVGRLAWLGLQRMTAQSFPMERPDQWQDWWEGSSRSEIVAAERARNEAKKAAEGSDKDDESKKSKPKRPAPKKSSSDEDEDEDKPKAESSGGGFQAKYIVYIIAGILILTLVIAKLTGVGGKD